MTKAEVRRTGTEMGIPSAGKGESFEICFIPDNNYERFLKERLPGLGERVGRGELVLGGKVVGEHRGYPFYTIGQRRGIGVAMGEPVYVTGIDKETNRVTLGPEEDLFRSGLVASGINLISFAALEAPVRVRARIRYQDRGAMATIVPDGEGRIRVTFDEPRRAITPGQSVVFYDGDDVVGGGVIDSAA
jgi:tRNA-specific 2-thiouridylase